MNILYMHYNNIYVHFTTTQKHFWSNLDSTDSPRAYTYNNKSSSPDGKNRFFLHTTILENEQNLQNN